MKPIQLNYEKSNRILEIKDLKFSTYTKMLYNKLRNKSSINQFDLQLLTDNIIKDMKIPFSIPVRFKNTQPHSTNNGKLKSKVMGTYSTLDTIIIYKYTAIRKKQITPKTAISTLLHEINHYADYKILNLIKSIHSKGFYSRLRQIENLLKD